MPSPPQKPPKRTRIPRLIIGNLVVLAVLLLLLVTAGEIYYRFFYDSTDSFALTRTSKRWFERHWQLNNLRIHDNIDYPLEKTPGKPRITFLGDSFTTGHGIKDMENRFANIVRKNRKDTDEVHLIAANGLDTGDELKALRQTLRKGYQTDVVVLVYVLNDISDLIPEWQANLQRLHDEEANESFFVRHSFFINRVYYQIKAARDPAIWDYYACVKDAYAGPQWETQKQRLADIISFCNAHQMKLAVVTFPFLQDIGPNYRYGNVHDQLNAFWADNHIPHLDLLPVYKSYKPWEVVVGKQDAHPNEFAHKKAAEAIDAFLHQEMK